MVRVHLEESRRVGRTSSGKEKYVYFHPLSALMSFTVFIILSVKFNIQLFNHL